LARHGPAPQIIQHVLLEPCATICYVPQRDPVQDKLLSYERDGRNDYGNSKKSGRKGVPWRKSWVNRSFRRAVSRSLVAQDRPDGSHNGVWWEHAVASRPRLLGRLVEEYPPTTAQGCLSATRRHTGRRSTYGRGLDQAMNLGFPAAGPHQDLQHAGLDQRKTTE